MPILERIWDEPTALYRLFNRSGELLYLGVAVEPRARIRTHERGAPWWRDVDPGRTQIEWFKNRAAALEAEAQAIVEEDPVHNVVGSPTKSPRRRHERDPMPYDDLRRLRVDWQLWTAFGRMVGLRRRSTDLCNYIQWRVENPTTPLPGRWRGPVKRVRRKQDD